jgi:hypothetical protein
MLPGARCRRASWGPGRRAWLSWCASAGCAPGAAAGAPLADRQRCWRLHLPAFVSLAWMRDVPAAHELTRGVEWVTVSFAAARVPTVPCLCCRATPHCIAELGFSCRWWPWTLIKCLLLLATGSSARVFDLNALQLCHQLVVCSSCTTDHVHRGTHARCCPECDRARDELNKAGRNGLCRCCIHTASKGFKLHCPPSDEDHCENHRHPMPGTT